MYNLTLALHSWTRWAVLILLIGATVQAWISWRSDLTWTAKNKKFSLFAMIAVDVQLLLGIVLYLISPVIQGGFANMKAAMGNRGIRFFLVEHTFLMVIALVLVHVGFARAKRFEEDAKKHKSVAIYYLLALLVILIAIPWPFIAKITRPLFRSF